MDVENNRKLALFKFSLIAPLVNNNFSETTAKEYLEIICAKTYDVPGLGKKEYAPATLKEWLRSYRRKGFDGLMVKSRSDIGKQRKLTEELKNYIISDKKKYPRKTAKTIYLEMILQQKIKSEDVSLSTVTRFLQKSNLNSSSLEPIERKAFEMEFPNDCWQADTSVGPYINIDGKKKKTFLIMFLDDSSRLVVHGEIFLEEKGFLVESVLKKAIAKRGIPKKIFLDNGKVYQNLQFQMICASLGTVVSYARAYSPQSKGKIERAFRTIKDSWMFNFDWEKVTSLYDLNASFQEYIENHYNKKIHSAINQTPMDKYLSNIDNIKFMKSTEELDNVFLHRLSRNVKKDATISIDKVFFEVPQKYLNYQRGMHMFKAFYGLTFNPFDKNIDTKHSFQSSDFKESMGRLEYLKDIKGFGLFTGSSGTGKTYLLRYFTESLNPNLFKVIYLPITTLTVMDFYRALALGLGIIPAFKKIDLFKQIQETIITYSSKNITPTIILDEAQYLKNSILDDLKILFNFNMDSKNHSILILTGQPMLNSILQRQAHEALRQRIVMNYMLSGLKREEIEGYVLAKLKSAGCSSTIFTEDALELISSISGGSSRVINQIVTNSLMIGFQKRLMSINSEIVYSAQCEVDLI